MKNTNLQLIVLLLVSYVVLVANIGGLDIYALDEARNAGCAHEMMQRGDWIVPTFNHELRVEKPPLHYYFMIISYYIFGFGEFSARFFSVLFGVFTIWITYLFAKRYFNAEVALYAGMVLAASTHYSVQFHMAVPDPYLIFFIAASIYSFFRGFVESDKRFLYLSYLCMGLGYMCKGPIAGLFPALTVFFYLLLSGQFNIKNILKTQAFLGFFIILIVIVPWHLAVGYATDWEWLSGFYYKHNVYRFTNEMEGHGGIFLLTWLYVLVGMLPLVVFLPQSLWQAWKDRSEHQGVRLYILLAGLSVVIFFSVSSTKLPNYTVPAYPFLGILIGSFIYEAIKKAGGYFTIKISMIIYTLLMLVFPVAVSIGIKYDEALSHLNHLGYYLGLLPIGALLALFFVFKGNLRAAVLAQVLSFMATTLLFFWLAFPQIDRENPLHIALPLMDKSKPTVGYKIFNPAFVFYLEKEIKKYEDLNAFKAAIKDLDEVYIITRKEHVQDIEGLEGMEVIVEQRDIFELPTTVVLRKTSAAGRLE